MLHKFAEPNTQRTFFSGNCLKIEHCFDNTHIQAARYPLLSAARDVGRGGVDRKRGRSTTTRMGVVLGPTPRGF